MPDLILEICDNNFVKKYSTADVISARITDELGAVGDGEVTLPGGHEAISYLPWEGGQLPNEGRWRLYEGNELIFSGVVDQTTRRINADNTYSFGGKQRGVLLGTTNVGRRDFDGWPIDLLYQELLYDNIGKAPLAVIRASNEHPLHPPVNAITGDPLENNYWAALYSGSSYVTIDLGAPKEIEAIRVIPPWWDQRWYKFTVETSNDDVVYNTRGSKTDDLPNTDRGKMYTISGISARYVRVIVSDSTDAIGRLASVLVYTNVGTIGPETTYDIPWIENDDSGNVIRGGTWNSVQEQGAFNGDGVLGNSLVTRLSGSPEPAFMIHSFRGTGESLYFTQGTSGGNAQVRLYLDGADQGVVSIPSGSYQFKGFEVTNLSSGNHTLKVEHVSGTPQIDYFTGAYRTSYRPIRDNDPSVGYTGTWAVAEGGYYRNYQSQRATASGSQMLYEFEGDRISIISSKGPTFGRMDVYMDGAFSQTVDLYNPTYQFQQNVFTWSGSFGYHDIRARQKQTKHASSSNYYVDIDGLEGNFAHILYMRSIYETNLRMLTRLSEITNSWLSFNHDASVDLLGSVGTTSNTIIREGENEGGTIINAESETDYSETCSAVLALATGGINDVPIKAFVIDMNAVQQMGIKIRKAENADANDAYLLTRQAWSELQDYKNPVKRWNVTFDPSEIGGPLEVGDNTILHSDRLNLTDGSQHRVGRIVTEYSQDTDTGA